MTTCVLLDPSIVVLVERDNDGILNSAFVQFSKNWDAQVAEAGMASSEHAVVFCLALALQATLTLKPGSIVFERPHGTKRIDLWLRPPDDIAFEVKFQRGISSGKNPPSPKHYGDLLAVLNKLVGIPARRRIFILVGDGKALNYVARSGLSRGSYSDLGERSTSTETAAHKSVRPI